jgi:3-oxoacyl-[acyl-carrier protein] reductase
MMSKTVVVVGASRGIGKEIVAQLAENSENRIIAMARNFDKLATNFQSYSNVQCIEIDLNSGDLVSSLEANFSKISKVDVLINNAGYLVNKPFNEITSHDFTRSYQINVIGVMQTVQALLPKMKGGAHIVNISSIGGFQGSVKFPGLTAYSTSKAALCSFTEHKDGNIKMNCLCLGAVQTEMLNEAFPGYIVDMTPEKMAEYIVSFSLTADQWMNGKIIPVSLSTP